MALLQLLRQDRDQPEAHALREGLRWLAQQLVEVEASELVDAQRYERTPSRTNSRTGYRPRRS
jgi:transposase-like protein